MNNFHQLYILTEHDEHYREQILERQLEGLALTEDRAKATILLAAPPMAARRLDEFPRLQWLHSAYAGVDTLMDPNCAKLSADQRQRHLRAPDRRVCDGLRYPISARFSPVSNPTS